MRSSQLPYLPSSQASERDSPLETIIEALQRPLLDFVCNE